MTPPKVEMVNVVTMEHGRNFAQRWFDGDIEDAFDDTNVLTWPEADEDAQDAFLAVQEEVCRRVFEAMKEQIAETFVRIANAGIEAERLRDDARLSPPRIETVRVVTVEHGETVADAIRDGLVDTSPGFSDALSATAIMTWPEDDEAAQEHYDRMAEEIRDRLFAETRPVIAEAFVRIASDVCTRERRRR